MVLSQQPSSNVVMDLAVGEAAGSWGKFTMDSWWTWLVGCECVLQLACCMPPWTLILSAWLWWLTQPAHLPPPAALPADSSRASLSPSSLSFTKSDWQEAQTVTLTRECQGQGSRAGLG